MTDNEIIKALECCSNEKCAGEKCPLHERTVCTKECLTMISGYALDLIQRQQKRFDKILSYIDRVENSGLGKKKALEYIRKFIVKGCEPDDR